MKHNEVIIDRLSELDWLVKVLDETTNEVEGHNQS